MALEDAWLVLKEGASNLESMPRTMQPAPSEKFEMRPPTSSRRGIRNAPFFGQDVDDKLDYAQEAAMEYPEHMRSDIIDAIMAEIGPQVMGRKDLAHDAEALRDYDARHGRELDIERRKALMGGRE